VRLLAIDPGSEQSAWLIWDDDAGKPLEMGIQPNEKVLELCRYMPAEAVAIEKVASYGMAVGAEVFETVFWSGRYAEAFCHSGLPLYRPSRMAIKMHLCHNSRAKDANIRQALVDRFTQPGQPAVGTKKNPGPLYGVHADLWSALAVALVVTDQPTLQLVE
jgi:hypothetical protein